MQLYLNGVLVGQNAYNGGLTQNHDEIILGGSDASNPPGTSAKSGTTNYYSGLIDEVGIWGIQLPAQQVQNVMQGGANGADDPNGSTIEVYAKLPAGAHSHQAFPGGLADPGDPGVSRPRQRFLEH